MEWSGVEWSGLRMHQGLSLPVRLRCRGWMMQTVHGGRGAGDWCQRAGVQRAIRCRRTVRHVPAAQLRHVETRLHRYTVLQTTVRSAVCPKLTSYSVDLTGSPH